MTLAREDEHIETLVGADQGVDHADGVGRVDVVVDVAVHQHQMAFQVGGDLRIGLDAVDEGRVALVDLLQDTVMLLAPPAVVDAVVVVAGAGDSRLEEIRIFQNGRRAHESAARMAVDAYPVKIDERMSRTELLDGIFLILKTIVAQVAVAVVVVPLRAVRVSAAVADRDHDHSDLGEPVGAGEALAPGDVVRLHLRTRINIVADRIDLCGVEVVRLVHRSVEVGDTVGGLHLESFRELVAGLEQQAEVGGLQIGDPLARRREQGHGRCPVHSRIVGHKELGVVARRREHVHVVHVQLLESAARERNPERVHLVRILVLVDSACAQQDVALLLVHPEDVLYMERPFGQIPDQRAVAVVEVDVRPSVALGPVEDLLSATDQERSAVLHVGPFPFGDDGLGGVGVNVHPAEIKPLEVTALAHHVEPGVVAKPLVLPVVQVVILGRSPRALQ